MLTGCITLISLCAAVLLCVLWDAFISMAWLWMLPLSFAGCWLTLAVAAFLVLWISCAVVKMEEPQEKDNPYYRMLVNLFAGAVIKILRMRVHTVGLEKTPKDGRFLLVCNHLNDLDPVTLFYFFRKSQLAFISKRENTTMFIVGKVMHKTMCQLVNRENDREALKTILKCIQLIKDDEVSIAVFPEGYTSMDGLLHPFRHGVFKIAQKADVPIVVCTLQNTQYVFKNILRLKPTDVHLHLIDVIPAEQTHGITATELGERIHRMMAEDLGPDLVLQPGQET